MNEAWQLESAVARHEANPDTFWIPSPETRMALQPGAGAKLLFVLPGDAVERMWVVVSDVVAPGRYRGRLANKPATEGWEWELGTDVEFGAEHICDVDDVPDWREQLDRLEAFAGGDATWAAYQARRT